MAGDQQTVMIRFEGESLAEAGVKARKLREELAREFPDEVRVELAKDDKTNQDFGATLVLVLGTPAVIAVARGIAAYLARDRGTITISKDGTVTATNVSGADAARIAEAMAKGKKQ